MRVVSDANLHVYNREGTFISFHLYTIKDGKALTGILGKGWNLAATSGRARALQPLARTHETTVIATVPQLPRDATGAITHDACKLPARKPPARKAKAAKAAFAADHDEDGDDGEPRPAFVRISYFTSSHTLAVHMNWISGSPDTVRARGAFDI